MNAPFTHEELQALRDKLAAEIEDTERQHPDIRPLPPMGEEEALAFLMVLSDIAIHRRLKPDESFMIGQLLSNYCMAIEARMLLGRRGRYFVLSEETINQLLSRKEV